MLNIILSTILFASVGFEGSSVSTARRAGSIFINPGGLGINMGYESIYEFNDGWHNVGLCIGNVGLGVKLKDGMRPNFVTVTGSKIRESVWLGYGYKFGASKGGATSSYELGAIYRPKKFVSFGLRTSLETKPELRVGTGLRPWTDKVTVFLDAIYKNSLKNYLYGIGIEPIDGIILSFKGNEEGEIKIGLEILLEKVKIGGSSYRVMLNEVKHLKSDAFVLLSRDKYPSFKRPAKKLVELTIKGSYPEMKETAKYLGLQTTREPAFYNLLHNIELLRNREDVNGLLINFEPHSLSIAQAEELRAELIEFKKAGKKIITFSNEYGLRSYYLASTADYIILTPLGDVMIPGLMAMRVYIKGTLDKLGIETDIERVGKYKSASEIFERKDMSAEDREQVESYLDDIWNPMITEIAESRQMEVAKFDDLINKGVYFNSDDALDSGLVDTLAYKWEVDDVIKGVMGKKLKKESIDKFLAKKEVPRTWKEEKQKIAILMAEGLIVTGESGYNLTPIIGGKYMGSETITDMLNKIRDDKSIKALVFRVNSGGGIALASEIIARALKRVSEKKPVIVSMSGVAGSGGYYISCLGDKIVADRFTLTGSIGGLGINLVMKGLYDKLGLSWDTVKMGEHADYLSGLRHLTKEEREKFRHDVEWYYEKFVSRVSEGRRLTTMQVDSIGQGRIWSGIRAKEIGLVDEIGGLLKAIEIAKKQAGIKEADLMIFPKPEKKFSLKLSPRF
ncbi:MAG: signal peptide peptidase SppA [bacterium]|nr:signal peptide peptidase SppA [bacterium]